MVDQCLNFEEQIAMIQKKLRCMMPLFYKIRDTVSLKTKLRIFYAYVYSRVNYCIEIYSNTYLTVCRRVGNTYNRIIKILFKVLDDKQYIDFRNQNKILDFFENRDFYL